MSQRALSKQTAVEAICCSVQRFLMKKKPFRYFKTSPEVIQLAVMM
ncbi:MAG: hypothetical protein ACFBZ9_17935 [Sphingomonadales bacterium]